MSSEKHPREAVIVGAARTPQGRFQSALGSLSATELGSAAIRAAVARSGVDPETVYEVIMGNVVSAGLGQAPARQAAIGAGLPTTVGGASVNKVCGSGLKAVMMAANGIAAGEAETFIAGGMESMSNGPYLLPDARNGMRFGHKQVLDAVQHDGLWCAFEDWGMGNAAEFIGRKFELTRRELDEFAYNSHAKAAAATASGAFQKEITPVEVQQRRKTAVVERDEPIRASYGGNGDFTVETTVEQLQKLRPAFEKDGIVTAGNAPGLNDGAAALVVMSRAEAERQGLTPLARVIGYTHAAVDPKWIFSAPAKAMPRLLEKIGWSLDDVDLIELNEAFATQTLANGAEMMQKGHRWDWEKVNVHGGAIALGHPVGASGARLLITLIYALQRHNGRRGIASLCLGGGEAVALAVELE